MEQDRYKKALYWMLYANLGFRTDGPDPVKFEVIDSGSQFGEGIERKPFTKDGFESIVNQWADWAKDIDPFEGE